jgi:CRP/FNR family transcriptional regulator, cyclic AMP receptor protein
MGKRVDYLKESDLFYNLTPTQLEMVDSVCEESNFKEGEIVITENTREKELYLILKGEVEILVNPGLVAPRPGVSAKPEIIATLGRGQSFGEIALVDEGIRTATVRAAGKDTILLKISRERLLMLCNNYPELGYKVMYNLAIDLANKIRNTDLRIRETVLYQRRSPGN